MTSLNNLACVRCSVSLRKNDDSTGSCSSKHAIIAKRKINGMEDSRKGFLCSRCFQTVEVVNINNGNGEPTCMEEACLNCKVAFKKVKTTNYWRGFNRRSKHACGIPPEAFDGKEGFLCNRCVPTIQKQLGLPHKHDKCKARTPSVPIPGNGEPMETCLNCKAAFKKVKKKITNRKVYNRRSKHACGIPPEAFDGKEGFLCNRCVPTIRKQLGLPHPKGRTPSVRTPSVPVPGMHTMETRKRVVSVPLYCREANINKGKYRPKSERARTYGFKSKAMEDVRKSSYKPAFVTLVENSERAKQAFYSLAGRYIKKEIKAYPKQGIFSEASKVDNLKFIPWSDIIKEASSCMPLLVQVLQAALPDPVKWGRNKKQIFLREKCSSPEHAKVIRDRHLGFILSVILYSHKPLLFRFIQGCISLQLRKYNCGLSLLSCLNRMGIALGLYTTLKMMDPLAKQASDMQQQSPDVQGGSAGASCSTTVDLQSLIFEKRSDVESDSDLDMVEELLEVTQMDF